MEQKLDEINKTLQKTTTKPHYCVNEEKIARLEEENKRLKAELTTLRGMVYASNKSGCTYKFQTNQVDLALITCF